MENESEKRLDRLFAAARAESAETGVLEEHFETRLMARIRERRLEQQPWYALAWRMVPAYAGIATIVAVCSFTFNPTRSTDVFAALTGNHEETISITYLAGE